MNSTLMHLTVHGRWRHKVSDLSVRLCVRTFARAYGHAGDGILRPACRQFLVISEVSIIVEVQVTVRGGGIKRYRDLSVPA